MIDLKRGGLISPRLSNTSEFPKTLYFLDVEMMEKRGGGGGGERERERDGEEKEGGVQVQKEVGQNTEVKQPKNNNLFCLIVVLFLVPTKARSG